MKKNRPKLYILPGWGDRTTDPAYRRIISWASKYEFVPLRFATRNRKHALGSTKSLTEIVADLRNQIGTNTSHDMIFGFSIGALLAYLLAQKILFGKVIICSISPTLGPDLKTYPLKEVRKAFPAHYKEMGKMGYSKLASKNVVLLYGEKEQAILKKRSIKIAKRQRFKFVEIKGGEHILNNAYLGAIKHVL